LAAGRAPGAGWPSATARSGFWNALRKVFPQARQGRCCFHKTANVLTAPAEVRAPGAKKALAEICGAEDKDHAAVAAVCHRTKVPGGRGRGPPGWR
jgi:transposase-like protein